MVNIIRHPRLRPHLDSLIKTIKTKKSFFRIYAETAPIGEKSDDTTLFDQVDDLAKVGYEYIHVRVYQGSSPNYEGHEFPLVASEPTPTGFTFGSSQSNNVGLGGLSGFGGLAGLGGDPMAAFKAEMDSRLLGLDNVALREKLREKSDELIQLKITSDTYKKELDRNPMYQLAGAALSGIAKGMLSTPAFRNTPLGGLLTDSSNPADDNSKSGQGETYEEVVNSPAHEFARVFEQKFAENDQQDILELMEILSKHPSLIAKVLAQVQSSISNTIRNGTLQD